MFAPVAAPESRGHCEPIPNVGRRSAARLRLSVPARLITVYETRRCVLLDLSTSGARIALERPLVEGEAGFLAIAQIEVFATVMRMTPGINGLQFDVPLEEDDVLGVRAFAERYKGDARSQFRADVEAWVKGGPGEF
ncbi:MAG: PilZ domain-containing protein [Pseudomonadota bacterium]